MTLLILLPSSQCDATPLSTGESDYRRHHIIADDRRPCHLKSLAWPFPLTTLGTAVCLPEHPGAFVKCTVAAATV